MKLTKTLAFFGLILLLLATLSYFYPQKEISFCGISWRFPSITDIIEIKPDTSVNIDQMLSDVEASLQIVDSAEIARQDSLKFYERFFAENPSRISLPDNDPTYLFPFFDAIDSASNCLVHIMHYGDSQIEGDRITGYLRKKFQEKFGGSGPGLLPMWQPIGAHSVSQTISDSVASYFAGGMMGKRADHKRYGAMAQMSVLEAGDSIRVTVNARQSKDFQRIIVFAGHNADDLDISLLGSKQTLHNTNSIKHLSWFLKKPVNWLDLKFMGQGEVYGINVDGNNGVSISNIPMRGSDGTFFTRIESNGIKEMLNYLNTKLIILEFGGNALPMMKDSADIARYCTGFIHQIDMFRRIMPDSKIIVIGTADMAVKRNGTLQTHPMLPYLVDCVRDSTVAHGAGYWDMYDVMGGYNSMKSWVSHSPAWAASDYVHFTPKGADRIAEVFWLSLMVYYDYRDMLKTD
ncbi:MAG: hypothetical protein J6Y82_09335 [Bacteroidales bacterium]|nr:hypothetical protein [Bacteroidales bacterium]